MKIFFLNKKQKKEELIKIFLLIKIEWGKLNWKNFKNILTYRWHLIKNYRIHGTLARKLVTCVQKIKIHIFYQLEVAL